MLASSCANNNRLKKKIGKDIVEARFIGDSIIDGLAKYYDYNDNLIGIANYQNGLKEGISINYYLNGRVKDSLEYSNGLLNGFSVDYDSLGRLQLKHSNYYGLSVGHSLYYHSGKIEKYYFSDFDKNDLTFCEYDSLGKCRLNYFTLKPALTEILDDDRKAALELFLYFPKPPELMVNYSIGLTNEKKETKDIFSLNDNRLFLDTVLRNPEGGWHYYVSAHIENPKDSINKFFIANLRTN